MKRIEMPSITDQPIMLQDVKRLRLEPTDVLVVRAQQPLSQASADMIQKLCKATFGEKQRVVVLDNNLSFEVYRASHKDEERSGDPHTSDGQPEANEGG